MKLRFARPHISLKQLADTNLPALTVATGLNGAGKTHLLMGIASGAIIVEGVAPHQVKFYNLANFRLKSPQALTGQQLVAQSLSAWQILLGQAGNPKNPWKNTAQGYFTNIFGNTDLKSIYPDEGEALETCFWGKNPSKIPTDFAEKKEQYEQTIRQNIFSNQNFKKNGYHQSITHALKKSRKPLHLLTQAEFEEHFAPYSSGDDYLSASLSVVFTKYKVKQFLWAHNQWDSGNINLSKEELYGQFEKENLQPWVIIDEIMEGIHNQGDGKDVFNFQITNPEADRLRMEDYQSYVFHPRLLDKEHGDPRNFESLSSGEQTLLALALSIYQSSDAFELPKVLLLDEIDASLHPSMTKALLGTLQSVFVDRGVEVILATHSPSTIALAPEDSIYVVNKGNIPNKISKHSRADAMELISEGYITLEKGLALFKEISSHDTCILTEGHNTKIIKQVLNLNGIEGVHVIEGLEALTCDTKLRTLFDFMCEIPHEQNVLFVWDCDYKSKFTSTDNTVGFVIPHNASNKIVERGIENAFPESAFNGFTQVQKQQLEQYGQLLVNDIDTIEAVGGGSARCMVAEVFFDKAKP